MEKLLLHVCCAPCSIVIIDELKDKYNLTVFFYNPNIYPKEEYLKRKKYVVQICEEWKVRIVDFEKNQSLTSLKKEGICKINYNQASWNKSVKGLENETEGGARCIVCFRFRMEKTAQFAFENGFSIFSTSLTSGRNKKASIINSIGEKLATKYNLRFLSEDWKKGGRQEKSIKMVKKRGIYRQNYCGCKYSMRSV